MNAKVIVKVNTPSLKVLELHCAQGSTLQFTAPLLKANDHGYMSCQDKLDCPTKESSWPETA